MKIQNSASIITLAFILSGCVNMPKYSGMTRAESVASHETFITEHQFLMSGVASKFIYPDRFGNDMATRSKAADALVSQMMAMRMSRRNLGSIYPGEGRKSTVFDGVSGATTFLIFCNGVCNNTVIKVKSLGSHLLAKFSTKREFPLIEVSTATLSRAHIEFEVEASANPSVAKTEIVITEFSGSMGFFF